MLSVQKLSQIAKKSQTSLVNVARDYTQALFLSFFYQQKEALDFLFKGGTAFHFVYQSPRYSEDLDFSALVSGCRSFEDVLAKTLAALEKTGLKTELVESKPTTGGCLVIFSVLIEELLIKIQLEISLRTPKKAKGEMTLVRTPFLPPFNIQIIEERALVTGKIDALLSRKKPRDFYDLYFLIRSDLKVELTNEQRQAISRAIGKLDARQLDKELKEFLPRSHRLIIKDLPSALKKELERA